MILVLIIHQKDHWSFIGMTHVMTCIVVWFCNFQPPPPPPHLFKCSSFAEISSNFTIFPFTEWWYSDPYLQNLKHREPHCGIRELKLDKI